MMSIMMPRMPRSASDMASNGAVMVGPMMKPSGKPRATIRSWFLTIRSMPSATAWTALAKTLKDSPSGPEPKPPMLFR